VGDSFKLFNASSYANSFSSVTLPVLTGNYYWTNKLAVDGTIAVVSPVNTMPANIVGTVVSNQLQISWPADHIGWRLEVQTNTLGLGLSPNWVSLGYETTNAASCPVDPGPGSVFYRLAYP